MRFSLKWSLAAMAYVALAAAAFNQGTSVYGDVLWFATCVAFEYAAVLTCFARDARRTNAGGFVILASCYLLCLGVTPQSVPTERLVLYVTGQPPPNVPAPVPTPIMGTFVPQQGFAGGQSASRGQAS